MVYAVFASLGVMSESRWCELRSMVKVLWRWSLVLELISPSSDTFPLPLSKLGYSNILAVVLYLGGAYQNRGGGGGGGELK